VGAVEARFYRDGHRALAPSPMKPAQRRQVVQALKDAASALVKPIAASGPKDIGDPLDFQGEFMAKYPAAKPLLKLIKGTRRGKARGAETASYEGGYVILKDDFYEKAEKYGREWAESVYAHELGHVVETEASRDIPTMAEAVGIDVWDRKQLPVW